MSNARLLLTGATGYVGGALLGLLSGGAPRQFVLLTRRPEQLEKVGRLGHFSLLKGDIARPHFGLSDHTYAELAEQVTEIIHCAADTHFGISLQAAREINTEGTQTILDFAVRCRQLKKFAHLSTVYVVGRSAGYFSESRIRHQNGFCNAYQQSKYEAEELVWQAMGEVPAAIFRLSSLLGDSFTGTVQQFNHVHRLIRLLPQNVLPVAPGQLDAPIDLVASDWVTTALAFLFDFAFAPGRFYHLCAGPENSLRLREMIDLALSAYESHPSGKKWMPIQVPDLVSLSCYEEFVEKGRQNGDRLFNELVRVLGYFLPHLAIFQAFENRTTTRALAPSGLQFPSIGACFERVVRFCLDTNWGRLGPGRRDAVAACTNPCDGDIGNS
jgi:nucleoside-diphosphate-sugar epimerase